MVRAAERAVVLRLDGQKTYGVHVVNPEWVDRFAAVLKQAVYVPDDYCFCIIYPMVEFYFGERKLTISLHHGDELRCSSDAISGDFKVGKDTVRELSALLVEPKRFVPPDPKKLMPIQNVPGPAPSGVRPKELLDPAPTAATPRACARVAPTVGVAQQ
ncbi:hypothetical protein DB347_25335 [Opitutaceae bacterium EW11]|nr:hypothetical protein DB347_25335 [Opitutaceae bacterium EW11]